MDDYRSFYVFFAQTLSSENAIFTFLSQSMHVYSLNNSQFCSHRLPNNTSSFTPPPPSTNFVIFAHIVLPPSIPAPHTPIKVEKTRVSTLTLHTFIEYILQFSSTLQQNTGISRDKTVYIPNDGTKNEHFLKITISCLNFWTNESENVIITHWGLV